MFKRADSQAIAQSYLESWYIDKKKNDKVDDDA